MASPTRWTRVWVNSGSWWWTRSPGVLWFMGSQRVRHDWATELKWTDVTYVYIISIDPKNKTWYNFCSKLSHVFKKLWKMKTHTIIYLFTWLPCMILFISCYRLTFPIDVIFLKYKELNLSISLIASWLTLYFLITWKFLWLPLFVKNIFGGYSTSLISFSFNTLKISSHWFWPLVFLMRSLPSVWK